ncbi:MAG: MBOAT family protein [Bacteroidales bacterium]|nr:MBOAT family protein [Bacteroidales bacterium]
MLFNSAEFLIFLPIVFAVYWLLNKQRRLQNLWVVAASYLFYGWWDWRFLILIAFTSGLSWLSGIRINRRPKLWLWLSVVINLAILGIFKYYDFFATELASMLGIQGDKLLLKLVLPVGISFYTFQALSYTIDVYKRKIEPTRDVVAYFAYVSFFPQLVAGPIERATNLLPQFLNNRRFDYSQSVDGMRQMLWGFFMKMAVADRCGWYVDQVWADYTHCSSGQLIMAAILFAVQIYGDFAGYSNIAIGCAKLFGINLRQNFRTPYFSRDIAEFWRRWHISLTTWFRDYLYIPLGGSRVSRAKVVRNTFIIFLVSGLWHGANWTFIAWGAYNALLFLPLILTHNNRKHTDTVAEGRILPTLRELMQMLTTFALCVVGWIIFRAGSIADAWLYIRQIFGHGTGIEGLETPWLTIAFIAVMTFAEWIGRNHEHGLDLSGMTHTWLRVVIYYALTIVILLFSTQSENFIYFQF